MIVWEEILVANGSTVLMMCFLLVCRHKNRESLHAEDRLYDAMALVNLLGASLETISFWVDGRAFPGGRAINYISNSICFFCTVSIALLWGLYVDLRIYRNYKRTMCNAKFVCLPWLVEVGAIVLNLFGTGVLFRISADNVYARCSGAIIGYLTLMFYFAYSTYLVYHSKRQGINLNFFPVLFFVGPCLAGVLIQLFCYGITTSWVFVAIAMTFVQMQSYSENLYTDELSGLYNRRYLNGILAKREQLTRKTIYGIMMDINDFKHINDTFGHGVGDRAICKMGDILFRSIPESSIAIRYAGDEFIVLLPGADESGVCTTMNDINANLDGFNTSGTEPFTLSVSMGYAKLEANQDSGSFLIHMDQQMYEQKRKYHIEHPSSRMNHH